MQVENETTNIKRIERLAKSSLKVESNVPDFKRNQIRIMKLASEIFSNISGIVRNRYCPAR